MNHINPKYITPLPRMTPAPPLYDNDTLIGEKYEAIVIGAGPTGLLLSTILTRYGLSSLLTIDAKTGPVTSGHADGINRRSLEVLASLGLHHDILSMDSRMNVLSFWASDSDGMIVKGNEIGLQSDASRFGFTALVGQSHLERTFNHDLNLRGNPVRYGWRFLQFKILDGKQCEEFPVEVKIQSTSNAADIKTVYAKYLIGADGAHSRVRAGMNIPMEGSSTDDVWGVVDAIVKTDFPDKRRASAIVGTNGSILWIPRERISPTEELTRVYVRLDTKASDGSAAADHTITSSDESVVSRPIIYSADAFANDNSTTNGDKGLINAPTPNRARRLETTLDQVLDKIPPALHPYSFKTGYIDWWASYQIGQRMAPAYTLPHVSPRVLIAGDACHTHSPKAGQGSNFGMADAQNLAWKLVYAIHGLVANPNLMVKSYEVERRQAARTLLDFDKTWAPLFEGSVSLADAGLRPDEFVQLLAKNQSFVNGQGVEYPSGFLVGEKRAQAMDLITKMQPGRILCSSRLVRFHDGTRIESQEAMYFNGKFRVVALLPDIPEKPTDSATPTWWSAVDRLLHEIQAKHWSKLVETLIIHPFTNKTVEWTYFPPTILELADRSVYMEEQNEAVYDLWGIEEDKGAVAIVRPDGYVGSRFEWGTAGIGAAVQYFDEVFGRD